MNHSTPVDGWPENMPRTLEYPECGADAILAGAARAFPDRVALRDGDETLTFAQLHDQALRIARALWDRGIRPGDAVGLHMPNSIAFVQAYYGALCAGVAVAPINTAQPAAELRRQLDVVGAKAVFTHPSCAPVAIAAQGLAPTDRIVVKDGAAEPDVTVLAELLTSEPLDGYRVDPELVAHLQLTGGTTGRPKAVRVLHRNLVANVLQSVAWRTSRRAVLVDGALELEPIPGAITPYSLAPGESAYIAIAPLYHALGLGNVVATTMLSGTIVFCHKFDPDTYLADVDRHQITTIAGSPAMHYALLNAPSLREHDLGSVRIVGSGAAPLDTETIRTLQTVYRNARVSEGYGLTEATMGVSGGSISADRPSPVGSVGQPMPDTDVEIRDGFDGAVLPVGEPGEIWVRGPQIADGYHNEPEQTAEQFVDGWLDTGDQGKLDDQGNLYIVGRVKDLIIYKGYNVYPQPLEDLVCGHPAVSQAAVVGAPDRNAGELPVAFVVLKPGVEDTTGTLGQEIMDHVAAQVAPYQKIRDVVVLDALPTTATGKVQKNSLREGLSG